MQADDGWVSRAIARVPVDALPRLQIHGTLPIPSAQLLADTVIPGIASFRVVRWVVGGREGVESVHFIRTEQFRWLCAVVTFDIIP